MAVFEKAKEAILENYNREEIYHGIAFLYYAEIITRAEYKELMEIYNKNIWRETK